MTNIGSWRIIIIRSKLPNWKTKLKYFKSGLGIFLKYHNTLNKKNIHEYCQLNNLKAIDICYKKDFKKYLRMQNLKNKKYFQKVFENLFLNKNSLWVTEESIQIKFISLT